MRVRAGMVPYAHATFQKTGSRRIQRLHTVAKSPFCGKHEGNELSYLIGVNNETRFSHFFLASMPHENIVQCQLRVTWSAHDSLNTKTLPMWNYGNERRGTPRTLVTIRRNWNHYSRSSVCLVHALYSAPKITGNEMEHSRAPFWSIPERSNGVWNAFPRNRRSSMSNNYQFMPVQIFLRHHSECINLYC